MWRVWTARPSERKPRMRGFGSKKIGAQVAGCVMKEVAGVDEGKDQGGQGFE